jgi:chromosome segregation ATPase
MHPKQRHPFVITATFFLLLGACTRTENEPPSPNPELTQLKRDFLQLQTEHQEQLTRMTAIKQENEALKAGWASGLEHDDETEKLLVQTQKKLNNQQREYQTLQRDYAKLEASIAPLVSRLKSSIAAHRKELIGTNLGTVALKDGRQLHQCEVVEVTDQSLRLKFDDGSIRVAYADLPPPIQQRFFYDPITVPGSALLDKEPEAKPPADASPPSTSPMEEAFAERHRQELLQHNSLIEQKIGDLENVITSSKQRIQTLIQNRSRTAQKFNQRSGSIKRSTADRDKALQEIDSEISTLGLAIKAAEIRINSWQKELTPIPVSGK